MASGRRTQPSCCPDQSKQESSIAPGSVLIGTKVAGMKAQAAAKKISELRGYLGSLEVSTISSAQSLFKEYAEKQVQNREEHESKREGTAKSLHVICLLEPDWHPAQVGSSA